MFVFLLVLALSPGIFAGRPSGGFGGLLYEKAGNVSLTGLFGHVGGECGGESERGLEEMISAIWTIEALNAYEYLPGITLGLRVFNACEASNDSIGLFKMAEELLDEDAVNIGEFSLAVVVFLFLKSESNAVVEAAAQTLFLHLSPFCCVLTTGIRNNSPAPDSNLIHIKHVVTGDMLADITIQLLTNLQWMNVSTLVVDSAAVLNSFREKALQEGISIRDSLLLNSSDFHSRLENAGNGRTVTVVIASFPDIVRLADGLNDGNSRLILSPTDFVFEFDLLELPKDTIVCLPSMQDKRALSGQLSALQRHKEFFTRKPPVKGPLFLGTAATILAALRPFKSTLEKTCPNGSSSSHRSCASAPDFVREIKANKTSLLSHETTEISPDDVDEALKVLKIEPSLNDEMFLCIASVVNANASEDFAIFQVFHLDRKTFRPVLVMINDDFLVGGGDRTSGSGPAVSHLQESLRPPVEEPPLDEDCDPMSDGCGSSHVNVTADAAGDAPRVSWRYLTWVSANTSVGFVGVTCTLSIMLFVAVKICRDDFLEGSPNFTLLLMVAVVLTYATSVPFHLEFPEGGFMCVYRRCVPPVVFAVLFSLLLSRSVMVAFSEASGGLSGHVNGYLQSVLCVFMIGVQVSITLQNWISPGRSLMCAHVNEKYNLVLTLAYDFLLLILLACVSPFIVRSKRNCREGLLFSISVFFIIIVWSAWISFYVLLPNESEDAAIAVGLNSTASVLLLCVFIPQMYFMASPFPRDPTVPSLSSLDRHVFSGGPHPDFKSNHALNDCAFGSYRNCDLGCTNPTFSAGANGSSHPGMTEHSATDGDQTLEASRSN